MPPPTLDDIFVDEMDALTAEAANAAAAEQNQTLRVWFLGDTDLWSGEPLDIAGIADAFDRDPVGQDYANAVTDGTAGEAGSFKSQSDVLAVHERAFRLRHATPIRGRAHAAARRQAHAADNGMIARTVGQAQDLLTAGSTDG